MSIETRVATLEKRAKQIMAVATFLGLGTVGGWLWLIDIIAD